MAKKYKLEDSLVTIQAYMQDVDRSLIRAALHGGMSGETRRHSVHKLRAAADKLEQFPLLKD